jgi:hypothetical protein
VAGISRELTLLLLGPQWRAAASLVFWFGIGAIPVGMRISIYSILGVTNTLRLVAIAVWGRLALMVPILVLAGSWGGAPAIAEAQAVLGVLTLSADFLILRRAVGVGFGDVVRCLYRPAVAALAMSFVLYVLDRTMQLPLAASLFVKISGGAGAYLGILTIMWLLARRPDGLEAVAFATAAKAVSRCMLRWR